MYILISRAFQAFVLAFKDFVSKMRFFAYIFLFYIAFIPQSIALSVDAPLANEAQEAQAKELFREIRCVVCQNEAIADSPAEVAADMRREIRLEVEKGKPSEQIKTELAEKYGDVILMKPPLKESTILLWFTPWLVLGVALIAILKKFYRSSQKC